VGHLYLVLLSFIIKTLHILCAVLEPRGLFIWNYLARNYYLIYNENFTISSRALHSQLELCAKLISTHTPTLERTSWPITKKDDTRLGHPS
jgi:hypothetical protein